MSFIRFIFLHESGITRAQAQELLCQYVQKAIRKIRRCVTVPLTQHQFDAVVRYVYNTGSLEGTQLLDKLNAGDLEEAAHDIALGPPYELAILYLNQETLLVNYCGGVIFFMEKPPHVKQVYRGKGKAEYTLTVPENSSCLQLRYKLEQVQAWLTIKDQAGRIVCCTKTGANLEAKTVKLPLSQVNELTLMIETADLHTKWQLDAAIY